MDATLLLLGVPRRVQAGEAIFLTPGRATQAAAILALKGDWVARDELTAWLWPDVPEPRARHNLRQLLHTVRRSSWGSDLEVEPTRVRWAVASDVDAFRRAVADGDWSAAARVGAATLLEGAPEGTSDAFDAWLRSEREALREGRIEAHLRHAAALADAERWPDAARAFRDALAVDDLLEEAVQGVVHAEACAGRRDAALRAHEAFRARLEAEVGLEPLAATNELVARVRAGALARNGALARSGAVATDPADSADPAGPATNAVPDGGRSSVVTGLGPDATPFVGRTRELAELHALLDDRTRRLVTIAGPGGTGKSRLARRSARERAAQYRDGVAWVPLADATDETGMVAAIARTLGIADDARPDALARAVASGERLLVLDEVEHLTAAPSVVLDLLDAAPGLTVVATSRAVLDVPGETAYRLGGLSLPPSGARSDPSGADPSGADPSGSDRDDSDATALLTRAVRRARPDGRLDAAERAALVALARTVDGNPLAMELAAGWMHLLEPSEVLAEVARDVDVLRDADGPASERHGSLRAVFESSWTLLGPAERDALARTTVFRGGFTRAAATEVAGVPVHALLALVNRSLLRREAGARFAAPTAIRRFAADELDAEPERAAHLTRRHEAWALELARGVDAALDTPEQRAALARLDADDANLTRALTTATEAGRWPTARALAVALSRSWRWRGRAREGAAWFARLDASSDSAPEGADGVRFDLAHGLLLTRLGAYDRADALFERAGTEARRIEDPGLEAAARTDRAIVAWRRGELDRARTLFATAVATYRTLGAAGPLAGALGNLGTVARDAGDLDAAHAAYDEALAVAEEIGHVWEAANVRNNVAIAYAYGGDLEAARDAFDGALAAQRSIGDRPGVARSLVNLGNVRMDTGDGAGARAYYREALDLLSEMGDREGAAHVEVNLGILAQRAGTFDEAARRYARALHVRRALGARGLVAQCVSCFLDLAVARGESDRALVLAGAVRSLCAGVGVPLTPPQQQTYDAALAAARAAVPDARAAEFERRGERLDEEAAVAFALGEARGGPRPNDGAP